MDVYAKMMVKNSSIVFAGGVGPFQKYAKLVCQKFNKRFDLPALL